MSKIRCRANGHGVPREPWAKFKCRWCNAWCCSHCFGTHDPEDPVGNALCDSCWTRREKRNKQRSAA